MLNLKQYLGETNFYDKKEKLEKKKIKSWLKSVCTFANGQGGKLIFGVNENNNVLGLENYLNDSEFISETIKTKIDNIPEFDIEINEYENKIILILTIFPGRNPPYFLVDNGSKTPYKRVGNQSVIASINDLLNWCLRSQNRTYDSLVSNKLLKDVSFLMLKNEYQKHTENLWEDKFLKSFELIDNNNYLTNAGALFADGYQVYQSGVFCTRWNGKTKTNGLIEALDDAEFEGNLLFLLNSSINFIKRNSKNMWRKGVLYRIQYPEYPIKAVQEVIVNALIHRDYSIIGSEVHIDMYDDRLEVYSPGGMFDGNFVQNIDLYNVWSIRRNPILADLFARMNLMERRGSGLKNILEIYASKENYREDLKPEFRSTESAFFVVLKNLNYQEQNISKNENQKISPSQRRKKIIEFIGQNPKTTAYELTKIFFVSINTIERDLAKLVHDGYVEFVGSSKNGEWKIKTNQ
ncbi:conserved hypothetical [Ureaplasma parvum serovar 3 str. ATCC 700970]|uniref:Conserved hypothetical n=1 Tax=Ureaplasma parvum serovar 3 (strain ATCC 700970) TaxID=273119 RepID=Q9PRA7_UREPA|nr:conserved hypothetical UU038 [imported] - Ureaplasma urealyticum [Ureaplasma urealyticum]AAF30443.1 conserved hypothetical [Ureaplasma parvum serovar 3 str. ATCC 700970]